MIVDFFSDYGFIIELSFAIGILVYPLKRKKRFLIKILGVLAVMFGFVFLSNLISENVFTVMIKHTLLYFFAMYAIALCFETDRWSAVFFGTAGLTVQHLGYKVGYLVRSYMNVQSEMYIGIIFYILVVFIVYAIAFIYVQGNLKDEVSFYLKNNSKEIVIITSTLILFTTVFQNAFEYLIESNELSLLLAISSYDIVSCILILLIMFSILRSSKLQHETKILEHVLNLQQKNLENSKSSIDLINVKYHDLKYIISSLDSKISMEELDSLNKAISVYDLYLKTGNEALDVILAEKRLLCETLDIKLNCIADGKILNDLPSSEIYSLFGNALDNAIYAVQEIDKIERRVVNVTVKESFGRISIVFENDFIGVLEFNEELPTTTKSNTNLHGFGLKSIKLLVSKYNGFMTVETANHRFVLSILI